ncbi:Fic family protein [Arcicella lustrica]|uniref:Fic family protein n=1 Tax=Arcicella lustrica TaxID=2984196 RepID=A0ABU5SPK3_9BACT|nr:Fic family protein [Arcicella sp. DC25W]MEA5429226.1 Fic family protein [Arcicella sp. DC25W]
MESTLHLDEYIAGIKGTGTGYKYFIPEKVNRQWLWDDPNLNHLLEKASLQIGQLNSYARLVPNIDLFLHMHIMKEAVLSSKIEGTQTQIDEALLPIEDISPERRDDWQEVNNYTIALNDAIEDLKTLPISSRLIRKTHATLLQGVRGEHKQPGEFRYSQNWIGGASLNDAVFIPPAHSYVNELMGDLENFLHNDEITVPYLIRIGIAHYQFETIHPFLDGNGRIGRLLIPLYLVSVGMLDKPLLYLSVFFEKDKTLYYDNLTRVRDKNTLKHWLLYFLVGLEETAKQACETLSKILELKNECEHLVSEKMGKRSSKGQVLLKSLFNEPFIRVKEIEKICGLSPKAANDLVQAFESEKILREFTGQNRNRIYAFEKYLSLFR